MSPVGLANTRKSNGYVPKSPRSLQVYTINPTTTPQASERETFYEVGDSTKRDRIGLLSAV